MAAVLSQKPQIPADIIPFSLQKQTFDMRFRFWMMLSYFSTEERVEAWKSRNFHSTRNMITFAPGVLIALIPLDVPQMWRSWQFKPFLARSRKSWTFGDWHLVASRLLDATKLFQRKEGDGDRTLSIRIVLSMIFDKKVLKSAFRSLLRLAASTSAFQLPNSKQFGPGW
jgi:hypothetical protein